MQTKKEEIKQAIIQSGIHEFKTKGYEKASIRQIVKSAHTTTGNFYNYFDSKKSLFSEIVKDPYEKLTHFIVHHNDFERPNELWELQDVDIWRKKLLKFYHILIPPLDVRFLLLMNCSHGTKYAHVREDLIKLLNEHFQEHIDQFSPNYPHREIGRIYAIQLLCAFTEIIKLDLSPSKIKELIVEEILAFSIGLMALLKTFN